MRTCKLIHVSRPRGNHGRRRGAALVEMALVLPIFFMVVLGVIEFGRAMMVAQLVTNSAREGARLGVLDGSSNGEVNTFITDFLGSSLNVSPGDVTIDITVTPAPGNTTSGNEIATAQARDLVTVRVELPFEKVQFLPGSYLASKKLVGQSAMRHE
ncbi:MAG: TadE/TadG family type IV pilus assembly protein [Planctomycetaceae bacterium]